MKTKKLLALFAAGIMLFSIGCKKDNNGKNGHSSNGNQIDDYTSHIAVEDMNGYQFRMLVRPKYMADQYAKEGSDDPIENAVYKRNKLVEEMFNIDIVATPASNPNGEDAITTILAGDDAFDIVFSHTGAAFQYALEGAAHNILDIETIDLTKPWWSRDILENCTLGGNLYVLDGDISTHRLNMAFSLYFNKNLFDELGLEYPYELAKSGEWTFDEFEALVKQGSKDLDGDGVITPENDRFGISAHSWILPINCIYTGGQRIYSKNEDGILELSLNTSKTVDIYDSYFDLLDSEAASFYLNNSTFDYEAVFQSGRALFQDGSLGDALVLRGMEDNFGILPFPKYTDEDEYAHAVNGLAHLGIIPVTVEDEQKTGAIIEALCAIGSRDVIPVFYEQSLKTKYARDDESEAMIDIIKDSIIYDVGYATGNLGYIGNDLSNSANHDFSSFYAARERVALRRVAQINEDYADYVE